MNIDSLKKAMELRHSVRSYLNIPLSINATEQLNKEITVVNKTALNSGVRFVLVTAENKAFGGAMAHYGKFSGVKNYLVVVGKKNCEQAAGYYGEQLVLTAMALGLNSCWVVLTYSRGAVKPFCCLSKDEKLMAVITLGYGANNGVMHKNKPLNKLCSPLHGAPEWFYKGMNAALLAPTAMNQQKFFFSVTDNVVCASARLGAVSKLDLGIVKFHFELGAGKENFIWE